MEGIKVYGTADFPQPLTNDFKKGSYTILMFATKDVLQTVMLIWKEDDVYADKIMEKILDSVELKKVE